LEPWFPTCGGAGVAVQQALDDMFRQRFEGGLAVLNMQVHIGIGTK
jgi:hypothetical protein